MNAEAKQPFIDAMPGRHSGDLCFAGTRVPVSTLFECLAGGDSLGVFLAAFPSVSIGQARFALHKATIGMETGPNDGEPCFADTGVPVRDLFAHLRRGVSLDGFLEQRPNVTQEQAEVALRKASDVIERDYGLPVQSTSKSNG